MAIRIHHALDAINTPPKGAKKLFIKSYGCQMNVYDAIRMGELMAPHGYHLVETASGADLVILNTCHIREKADEKVFSDIGRICKVVANGAKIAVGGCVGQAMGEKILKRAPAVSIVFGPQTIHRLPEFVARSDRGKVVDVALPALEKFDNLPPPQAYGPTAFVTIQEGCDKFCTYCVVPYTRGEEVSRPATDIITEINCLTKKGIKEVTLLGQNVNAYDDKQANTSFVKLIKQIASLDGIERIRFTTSHPFNMTDELIELFASEPKLMPYLHLPVQSGSNKILEAMNRTHTAEEYIHIIKKVKNSCPDIAISGDFIVGFPTEDEDDYMQTLALIAQVDYSSAYSFGYSPRPGTPAATMNGQINEAVKKERLAGLQALLDSQQYEFNKKFIGKTVEVLVEHKNSRGNLYGKSPQNISVYFEGSENLIGKLVHVNIEEAKSKSIIGKVIN